MNVKAVAFSCVFLTVFFSNRINSYGQQSSGKNLKINYDSLRVVLEQILEDDQEPRRILIDSIGFNSPETAKYMDKIATLDTENRIKVKAILDRYGWIEQSKIGEKAAEGIFYVVQHADLDFKEQYFPQLKKLAERGEAKKNIVRDAGGQDINDEWKKADLWNAGK